MNDLECLCVSKLNYPAPCETTEVQHRMAKIMGIPASQVHAIMDLFEFVCDEWFDEEHGK